MKTTRKFLIILFILVNINFVYSQWEQTYVFNPDNLDFFLTNFSFSFSSPQNGWITYTTYISPSSGEELNLEYTNDYGNSWTPITINNRYVYACSVKVITAGPDTVYWFCDTDGGGFCLYSFNNGQDWEHRNIDFTDSDDMFLVNRDLIYSTSSTLNQNKIFKITADSTYLLMETDTIKFSYPSIFFSSSQVGYITAKDTADNNILLITTDGGNSWIKKELVSNLTLNNIYFTSDSVGYICCSDGRILKTNDYGDNFTEYTTEESANLTDISFVNDSCGYCVGTNGTYLFTYDSGTTWISGEKFTEDNLHNIQMFTMKNGYVLGSPCFYSKNNMSDSTQIEENKFAVYPNPVKDYLNISSSKLIKSICIYDAYGTIVSSIMSNSYKIDVSELRAGIYFVKVTFDKNSYIEKIIKK